MTHTYTTTEVAKFVGVTTRTIRMWLEAGVIQRPEAGSRHWTSEEAQKVLQYRLARTPSLRQANG